MRISDWSSDVCSSDLQGIAGRVAVIRHRNYTNEVPGTLLTKDGQGGGNNARKANQFRFNHFAPIGLVNFADERLSNGNATGKYHSADTAKAFRGFTD